MEPHPMRSLSVCGLVALSLVCGCRHDISGSYIASDPGVVVWLQLVRTPDNHLTGQLASATLKPDGTIDRRSVSVAGAVDGEDVTLTGSGLFGLQTGTLSGTINGDTLTLTGAQAQPFVLNRSTLDSYQAQLGDLDKRAQAILAQSAAATARQNVERGHREFLQTLGRV